jgi:predicted ATPase/DNA-binding winged helix-turn-helix (wHTH) protein
LPLFVAFLVNSTLGRIPGAPSPWSSVFIEKFALVRDSTVKNNEHRSASNEKNPKKSRIQRRAACPRFGGDEEAHLEPSYLTYLFGEFTLDPARGCVLKRTEEIKLRPKAYEALKYLVENPGRLIGKEELIRALWPDAFVTDDSLVQCTVELRRALDDRTHRLLKTVPRRGYVFTAPVVRQRANAERFSAIGPAVATESPKVPFAEGASKKIALPTAHTSLIGREQEVARAADLLLHANVRLLTVTGAGGVGKTRLALAIAATIADKFVGGVQFVGLASITHPDLVVTALAKAFGIRQAANLTVPQLLADRLQDLGPFLLLLDNFEQVLPAATVVAGILAASTSLKVLVTSRACLRIYGEQEFPIAPLEQNSAIELFAQRAAAVRPNFVVSSDDAATVQKICSRLDGLPLAIELAAARIKVLSPQAILDRLERRLQLLTGGALDLPERQQTLRKAIDWSHDLLNEAEQKLFRRFSVFVGGCTLEAAEAVCNTDRDLGIDLFDGASSLVDKNLLQSVDGANSEPRFTMLETIREYALECLAAGDEESAARRAHAAYCLVLAEEGNPELSPSDRAVWLASCDLETDNFRSALDWLFESQNLEWALRLCLALFRFWDMREHLIEGRSRLETALRLSGEGHSRERAKISHFLGALATAQGDFGAAERFLERSLSLYKEMDDPWGTAVSLNALAVSARDRGDYSSAQYHFEQSLACWSNLSDRLATARCLHNLANVLKVRGDYSRAQRALRDATSIFEELGDHSGAAWSINQQGDIARENGDLDVALDFYQRALSAFRGAGDRWGAARSLTDLGYTLGDQGDYAAAHAAYREALTIFSDLGHRRGIARALEGSACLAMAQGYPARALKLAASAARLRRLIGAPLPQAEQLKLDQNLRIAWESLSELEGKNTWSEGQAMSLEKAVQYSLEEPQSVTSLR